ncbi:uncharacterized protein LOC142982589 [Anticarsia gemmatalis]|uniref:uncharacterized protein LOC142982589 n=1 Tax=Anticarsia gemmatalis TaxID=129554 RepID=UPI003F76C8ED
MGTKIYFFLFTIITLTNGKPAKSKSSVIITNESELEKLLKSLSNKGRYNVEYSHDEVGPNMYHEDRAWISHQDTIPPVQHRGRLAAKPRGKKRTSVFNKRTDNVLQQLLNKDDDYGADEAHIIQAKDRNNFVPTTNDNIAEVLEFLKDLDKNVQEGERLEARNKIITDEDTDLIATDEKVHNLIQSLAKKHPVNNDLDAIVLDLSNLDRSNGKSRNRDDDDDLQNEIQFVGNIDLNDLIGKNGLKSAKRPYASSSDSNIDVLVVDLDKAQNSLRRDVQALVESIDKPKKQRPKQRFKKFRPKSGRNQAKILAHNKNNNNVYVPKWLLSDVSSKMSGRQFRNVLPQTRQQRIKKRNKNKDGQVPKRIFRRSLDDDIGVPFHLQIEGLGQVNP